MRRVNLTISFDPGFVDRMDHERGEAGLSRGRWLEEKGLRPNPYLERPVPEVERSPSLPADSVPSRESPQDEGRRVSAKPVQPRPIIQKRK